MLRYLTIFGVALAVRLAHLWQMRASPLFGVLMGDSRSYDEWARRIAGGEWIGREVFYQAPIYPYFLGAVYTIAGHHLFAVRVLQAALGSLACVFLALAGERFFSRRVGLIAGIALALYAPAIFFDGLIQKSTLDVLLICLALWLLARGDWWWTGVAIGALTLTRENAIVFTAVIAAWAAFATRDRARAIGAFLLGVTVVVLPVAIRNSLVGGGFYVTTSQFGPNFYIGNNPRADGSYASLRYGRGAPEYERQDATEIAERAAGRSLTPSEVSSYWRDKALDFVIGRPGDWLALVGRKTLLLLNRTELVDTESQESHAEWSLPLRVLSWAGHFGILVPLAVAGMILSWPHRARLVPLYAMLLVYGASVVLFYVFARYRYPLVPLLILFAAAGIVDIWERPRLAPLALAAALFVAVVANVPVTTPAINLAVTENNLGSALQSDGRVDDAIAHYRRAIALRPEYAPAYSNLASALKSKGQVSDAIAAYEQALRVQPDYPEADYNLGNALFEAGRGDEAIAHYNRAQSIPGAAADLHNNLGIALMAGGKSAEAIAEFRQAVRADPQSAQAHRNLGDALAASGARVEGLEHFRRAVELRPSDAALRYDLGSALLEAGSLPDAITELHEALRLDPKSVAAHNNLGIALGTQGRLAEAIAEFDKALALDPDFADAQRNRATAIAMRPK